MTVAVGDPVGPIAQPLPIGSLVYLASYLIRMKLNAETTGPDTPNLYSADLKVMGDQGDINTDPLVGPQGYKGQHHFPLRIMEDPPVDVPEDLPTDLTDTPTDIGKYWLLDDLDQFGNVIGETAWIWWGTSWRTHMMGVYGPPGPVPGITPEVNLIPPEEKSWIETSGTIQYPTWIFHLASPYGPVGDVTDFYDFPDWDTSHAPVSGDIVTATGRYNRAGQMIWEPRSIRQYLPGPWSMPENAFSSYSGVSQRAPIGSYAIPPQPWPWTPVVWGHLGAGGLTLSANPLMIGCEVLLGDPVDGIQISRGLGNTLGEVNIMPHYSDATHLTDAITPTNRRAVVPANHTGAQGTVYINLWNDGALGVYNFNPQNAQVFVMAVPIQPQAIPVENVFPGLFGEGTFTAELAKV